LYFKEENTKLQQSPSKRQPSPAKHQQSPSKHSPHKNMIQENWTSNSSEQVTIKKENNDDQEMMETDQLETCNDQEMLMNHNPLSNQTSSSNQDSPKSRGLVRDYDINLALIKSENKLFTRQVPCIRKYFFKRICFLRISVMLVF
jgi:hypothetical protein